MLRRDRHRCDLITEQGPGAAGLAPGPVSDPEHAPCTGDWVALAPVSSRAPATASPGTPPGTPEPAGIQAEPVIVEVLTRRTALVRSGASRRSTGQVLAANIDLVLVVAAITESPRPARLERLIALAWESGATPLLVLTKADAAPSADPAHLDPSWQAAVEAVATGIRTLTVSARSGLGLEGLRGELAGASAVESAPIGSAPIGRSSAGRSAVLVGPSGVGKSTLVNALLGTDRLAVGAVRGTDGKGRHTTVRRELVALPSGGVLIDTPGIRGIGLWGSGDGVDSAFAEITDLAAGCHFTDCEHRTEPGCAVLAAVEDGSLPARRLTSYRKLQRESAWMRSREDARLAAEERARWKSIHREQRRMYADRQRHGGRR
ncbi:ribosome biogenesis GTPase [Frankia sp. EI5c]|nr:ribosome biogenesis GTPase [Frankia sp. EI5c]